MPAIGHSIAPTATETPPPQWRSIAALVAALEEGSPRPTWTQHGVRHYIRHAASNGLAPYIRRIGRKILIDEVGFRRWIAGQGREVA